MHMFKDNRSMLSALVLRPTKNHAKKSAAEKATDLVLEFLSGICPQIAKRRVFTF